MPESRHVLGVLSLAGLGGASLGQVASALGLPATRVSDAIRGIAQGGTVDEAPYTERPGRLRVQPELLRYALVRDVFFGGPGSLDVDAVLEHLGRLPEAVVPLIGALHRGAPVDRALLRALIGPRDLDALCAYALVGDRETGEALELAPHHRGAIARAAYEQGLAQERTLPILMELAIGDRRTENQAPDHPLRLVGDHLHKPATPVRERSVASRIAADWLSHGNDPEIGFRVLMHALNPAIRDVSSDPGSGRIVTIREGVLSPPDVETVAELWNSVLARVETASIPPFGPILEGLRPWVYPTMLVRGQGPGEDTARLLRKVAAGVIARLAVVWNNHAGALHELRQFSENARLQVKIEVAAEFDALFPRQWSGSDDQGGLEGWGRRNEAAIVALAASMKGLPDDELARAVVLADRQAAEVGHNYPRLTPRLAELLAAQAEEPGLLLAALQRERARLDVLQPVLVKAAQSGTEGWESTFQEFLDDEETFSMAAYLAITMPVAARFKDVAISRLSHEHANLIDTVIIQQQVDADTAARLLNAPSPFVARQTAISLAMPSGALDRSDLSTVARARWREVILHGPADDYWYSVILAKDVELFSDWLLGLFERLQAAPYGLEFLHENLLKAIAQLPTGIRVNLLRQVPAVEELIHVNDVIVSLVSSDVETTRVLLDRADLADVHWLALRDGPNESWMQRALCALDQGWQPERVVAQVRFADNGWGEESQHSQKTIDAFESLRGDEPGRASIVQAGIRMFTQLRDEANETEYKERVFGI